MIRNEEYIEVDIKALFFYILRRWKPIVIWGLALALFLGGWMAYSEYSTGLSADPESGYWMEYQQYQDQIATYEDHIALTQARLDTLQEYLDESILMRLDPRNSYRAKAVYYVDSGYQILPEYTYQDTDKTSTLTWYYRRYITDYSVYEEIGTEMGIDAKYLDELIEVSLPNDSTFYISVRYPTQEGAIRIVDMMQAKLEKAKKELTESVGDHTLTLMEDNCGTYIDDTLKDTQKLAEEEMMELKDDLLTYSQELFEIKEGPSPAELNVSSAFIKWFIIGGVLGAGIVVVYLLLMTIVGNRIHASSQLISGFHADVLGAVICSGEAQPFLVRKINGMEGCLVENSEANLEFIAENIKKCCGGATNIVVCCDTESGVNKTIAAELEQYLPGIHLLPIGSLLKEAAALRALAHSDAVLMVTERDKSKNTTIQKIMKVIHSYEKNLIGFIMSY